MATGFLQVMVTTQTALPLENVKITVIDSATQQVLEDKTAYTDSSGQTPLIELDTVEASYSLQQDNTSVLPDKNYDIIVEKEFFIRGQILGAQLYTGNRADATPHRFRKRI